MQEVEIMKKHARIRLAVLLLGIVPLAGQTHHSVPVNFDMNADIEVTGVIKKTKWVNPHSQVTLEVTAEDGSAETWLVEMNAHNTIRRLGKKLGWSTDEFVVGETIKVGGWPSRHNNSVYFRRATLQSGKEIIWESRLDPNLQRLN
jgi:hypothetical protein